MSELARSRRPARTKPPGVKRRATKRTGTRGAAIPRGSHTVTPYLTVRGAAEALFSRMVGAS